MKIAAYVVSKYAKQAYVKESHDVRAWPGFEVVLDAVRRAGFVPEYAGATTAHVYDVVLVSITSDCDWWPFVAERVKWKPGKPLVVAGGAGVLNVRPFLDTCGAFVLGRGEVIVPEVLAAHNRGERYESASVVWSDAFDVERQYEIAQAAGLYPHDVILTNGKPYRETSIGCPNRCLFCGYTWHRRYIGDGKFMVGGELWSSVNRERTILDLLKLPPSQWQDDGPLRIVGLDGMSERLRQMVNKPITREMFKAFLRGLSDIVPPHQVKIYCIVGYPNETEEDWAEFCDDLRDVDARLNGGMQWGLQVHFTPFRAMPATPAACWQMSLRNYRGVVAATLKTRNMPGKVFFQGNRFWAFEGLTESLPTVIQSAVCLRGTEQDANGLARVASSYKYTGAPGRDKEATLRKVFNVESLFAAHTWDTLPTRYLRPQAYCPTVNKPVDRV